MTWESKIVGSGTVALADVVYHPLNIRVHPEAQRITLLDVLNDVGFIAPIIINQRSGRMIDGHLRATLALEHGFTEIDATFVDLDDAEEKVALLTFDALASQAEIDQAQLQCLLDEITSDSPAIQALLAEMVDFSALEHAAESILDPTDGRNDKAEPLRYLKFGTYSIPLTDEEYEWLETTVDAWMSHTGSLYGFVNGKLRDVH